MGTFTKSFGAIGGYISGSEDLIRWFRQKGHGYIYCEPMAPPICQQILSALGQIMEMTTAAAVAEKHVPSNDLDRIRTLHDNSIYFMRRLKEMGFIVYGDEGSPIVPLLIYNPAVLTAFSREALALGMALVVVGPPATPLAYGRARFCISAAHTRAQLDSVLDRVSYLGDKFGLKFKRTEARSAGIPICASGCQ